MTRRGWAVLVVVVLAVVGIYAWNARAQRAEQDRQSDRYYCTLSNVTPDDRAPKSGDLCRDILED